MDGKRLAVELREYAKHLGYCLPVNKLRIDQLLDAATRLERIEEYRAKLEGEAQMDRDIMRDAFSAGDRALADLDVMRSARRLEYFNELFPAPSSPGGPEQP